MERRRKGFEHWSRTAQAGVIAMAVIVLTWIMSFLAVVPEKGDVPIRFDAQHASPHVVQVVGDPLRPGLRIPAGNSRFQVRFRLPADLTRNGYVLFADHILADEIRFTDLQTGVVLTGSAFRPRGMTAGGASPFYMLPLHDATPGSERVVDIGLRNEVEQTIVLRVMPMDAFRMIERRMAMGQAMRYGALLVMVVMLLSLHLATGEPASLAYVWMGLVTLLSLLQLDSYLYLLPGTDPLGKLGMSVFFSVRSIVVIAGIYVFLWMGQLEAPPPRLRRIVGGFCLLLLALSVLQGLRWMPESLIEPLGWLYLLGSMLLLWLGVRAIRNRMPLARTIFVLLLLTVVIVAAADFYDMGLLPEGWWLNATGIAVLIVWLGAMGVALIRRTERYRHQLDVAAEHQRQLQRAADTDGLTGLDNRAALDARMRAAAAEAERYSVLFVDIDHFKQINDRLGHAAGDEVLRRVSAQLAASVREGDLLGRYGGEEFVIFAAGAQVEPAEGLAERVRLGIQSLRPVWKGEEIALTVSIGIAHGDAATPIDDALARADAALYAAKRNGRNRVAHAPP